MSRNRFMLVIGVLVVASMILSACGGGDTGTVATPEVIVETVEVEREAFTTPHPVLSDLRVRQALAYCTNKLELIQSVYPLAAPEQQEALILNTMIASGHWAYAGDENITIYDFNVEAGAALLEEAGWTYATADDLVRTNADGETLSLKFSTTSAAFRKTWGAVWAQQMAACGIEIIQLYVPASWWFGDTTGLARRDFELGAYAWVGEVDPGGVTLYTCSQIPSPSNGWEGQNYTGWCNEAASNATMAANNTLSLEERKANYLILQQEYTADVPTLPLFNRTETFAHRADLVGFEPVTGEKNYMYDIGNCEIPELDNIIIGFTQEPASLFNIVEDAMVTRLATYPLGDPHYTTLNYAFQAGILKDFPTIDNGGSVLSEVTPVAGDMVVDADGNFVELAAGVMVKNFAGEVVEWAEGVTMQQLVSTYEYVDGITWQDGTPVTNADIQLYKQIACDPESGATSFIVCDRTADDTMIDGKLGYVHTWVPGYTDPLYFVPIWDFFPAHRVISDGRVLADVPASEWATLPEIAVNPFSYGPYQIVEWVKGEKITYIANPYWVGGAPKTPNLTILFVSAENAEALLLGGEVDILDSTTLAGLSQALADAETAGQIKTWSPAGGTWEHIDLALFIR
jgi:ABC-type transport system substrate-binding protein